ncbi:MAG: hypothetical protein V3R52_07480 [Candidatus Neomarinimicrobiota bacterium]
MAKGTGLLFSSTATGTIGKTIVYSAKGVRKIMKLDRLIKNCGIPLIFFEDCIFGQLYSMFTDHHWFSFFSFSRFFTYFTKRPYTSNTAGQQNIRGQFTAGHTAWTNLTDNQKQVYRDRAVGHALTGYNIFMKEYIKENYVP